MYYETLGLDDSATIHDIKSAYRRLAKMYHPDVYTGDNGETFKEITVAYNWLMHNHNERRSYSGFQNYYEFLEKEQTSVTIHLYDTGNEVETDSSIWLMKGTQEFRLHVKKGTKIPTKLVITNAVPNITVELRNRR